MEKHAGNAKMRVFHVEQSHSAETLVDVLYEDGVGGPITKKGVCAYCQKEQGIEPKRGESHTICRKHDNAIRKQHGLPLRTD